MKTIVARFHCEKKLVLGVLPMSFTSKLEVEFSDQTTILFDFKNSRISLSPFTHFCAKIEGDGNRLSRFQGKITGSDFEFSRSIDLHGIIHYQISLGDVSYDLGPYSSSGIITINEIIFDISKRDPQSITYLRVVSVSLQNERYIDIAKIVASFLLFDINNPVMTT